jgi:hypothetical protein
VKEGGEEEKKVKTKKKKGNYNSTRGNCESNSIGIKRKIPES